MPASTAFYPGPDEVRIQYTSGGVIHTARYNCQVVDYTTPPYLFSDLHLLQTNGGNQQLDTWVDAWVALMRPLYNNAASSIDFAELWSYEPNTYNATFQATYDISLAGTSATAVGPVNQNIYQFRTYGGHRMGIQFMSSIRGKGTKLAYAGLTADEKAIVDALLGATNCWAARDNNFPASFVHMLPGESEALFKKIYR